MSTIMELTRVAWVLGYIVILLENDLEKLCICFRSSKLFGWTGKDCIESMTKSETVK